MISMFDIFQSETNGDVLWVETAPTMEEAKARVRRRAIHSPGEYIILDENTGHRALLGISERYGVPITLPDTSTQTSS